MYITAVASHFMTTVIGKFKCSNNLKIKNWKKVQKLSPKLITFFRNNDDLNFLINKKEILNMNYSLK